MSDYVASLDEALAYAGEDVILRRTVGTGAAAVNVDVTVRAAVRALKADELVGTLSQSDSMAIISPTQIIAAQWPGGQPVSGAIHQADPRVPKIGDKAIIQGRVRDVLLVKPILVAGELVRIELTVKG
jgi:hypothetical protein